MLPQGQVAQSFLFELPERIFLPHVLILFGYLHPWAVIIPLFLLLPKSVALWDAHYSQSDNAPLIID